MEDDALKVNLKRKQNRRKVVESDDEGDDCEMELDIVLCREMEGRFMRLQLPARKKDVFAENKNARVRYKRSAKVMEVQLDADLHSGSYDKSKAERLGERQSSSISNARAEIFEGRCFDHPLPLLYSLAYFRDGKLFLCPFDGSIELKRGMTHLNIPEKGKKKGDVDGDMTGGESEAEAESAAPQAVRVKFARQETERQKKRREASALHRESEIANEEWTPVNVYGREMEAVYKSLSDVSVSGGKEEKTRRETRRLVSATLQTSSEQTISIAGQLGEKSAALLSMLKTAELPSHLQIRALLLRAFVLSTDQTSTLLRVDHQPSRQQLCQLLSQYAHLVQGMWVVKSDVLFCELEEMRRLLWRSARDAALAQLDAGGSVQRASLASLFRLSISDVSTILHTLGSPDLQLHTWILHNKREEAAVEEEKWMLQLQIEEAEYWAERWKEVLALSQENNSHSPSRQRRLGGRH